MIASGAANGPARTITHRMETMPAARKAEWLGQFLRREAGPVLVFARTKRGAERLAPRLAAAGVRAAALHADRTQAQRSAALEGLRSGRYTALVATDVAARGLDIEAVTHVVNYEVPATREAYVHRVGRTGRADTAGTAVTLVAPEERQALELLARDVGIALGETGRAERAGRNVARQTSAERQGGYRAHLHQGRPRRRNGRTGRGPSSAADALHTVIDFDDHGLRTFVTNLVQLEKTSSPAPVRPKAARRSRKATVPAAPGTASNSTPKALKK